MRKIPRPSVELVFRTIYEVVAKHRLKADHHNVSVLIKALEADKHDDVIAIVVETLAKSASYTTSMFIGPFVRILQRELNTSEYSDATADGSRRESQPAARPKKRKA